MLSEDVLNYSRYKSGEDFTTDDIARRYNVNLVYARDVLRRLTDRGQLVKKGNKTYAKSNSSSYWLRIPWGSATKKAPDEPGLNTL